MLPDQSQGACQAIEDAAALGVIFSRAYTFTDDISAGLRLYERIRKPRATKVQAASARARKNLSERIGFSSKKESTLYRVESESGKLTIEEINGLIVLCLSQSKGGLLTDVLGIIWPNILPPRRTRSFGMSRER
jgi:salicylate hydroxylase